MCGIAGLCGPAASRQLIEAMTRRLAHRGPDGEGFFGDGDLWLGHTRLSIIDLVTGDQPMMRGGVCLVYNGEVYNFRQLRARLEGLGASFRTSSDSEVILEGYRAWGTDVFARLDGMFALALWDATHRRLLLARDASGIKPMHWSFAGGTLRFASEIKALLEDPSLPRELDFQAVHHLLNLRYVPGRRTLLAGVERLLPGHLLRFEDGQVSIERFWRPEAPEVGGKRPLGEDLEAIRHHLGEAVRRQLVSDVPLGVYLSGGLDSSSIVAFMAEHMDKVRTFSLGFGEPSDELGDARLVARHFGTEHHEIVLDAEPLRHYPAVIWACEEPKENILQGYLLARFARSEVKAVLGGLGGDELFAGYVVHRLLGAAAPWHRLVPAAARRRLLEPLSRSLFRLQHRPSLRRLDQYRRGLQLGLSLGDPCGYYTILRNVWDGDTGAWGLYGPAWRDHAIEPTRRVFDGYFPPGGHPLRQAMDAEFDTKMVDDFLLNEDRTSMAHGLEVRVPFLDRELVQFARSIDIDRLSPGLFRDTKQLFRRAMEPLLPAPTLAKKKWGFTVDSYRQFQKDLRPVAERVLTRRRVEQRGLFDYGYLRSILDHPPHPRMRWHYFLLWLVLGLEIWSRIFLDGRGEPDLELESYF